MAPQRKRENRENNFYNVGVQGRKTGITLADRGVYDEHGLEALSGIFSSPEKSPPKRGGNITASESMDIQESSIPELTTSHQILRNSRTHLPPPRSRSPKKTMLGSSPRRQSSAAPRRSSVGLSSPVRATSHPTARRLDFEQDESSLQETPALSGSGARRNKRNNVYDIPEDESPAPQQYDTILEESMVQEELANDDSVVFNAPVEESFAEQVGDDTTNGAEVAEVESEQEESEIVPEPVAQPAKRGRKRKSDVIEPEVDAESSTAKSRKRGPAAAKTAEIQKTSRKDVPGRRRSQRTSDIDEQDPSILNSLLEDSEHASAPAEEAPGPVKRRGRPPRAQPTAEKENAISTKTTKPAKTTAPANDKPEPSFRKPEKPAKSAAKSKAKDKLESKVKPTKQSKDKGAQAESEETGKLVDVYGNPLSKQDIEKMSVTSTTSRFGRGRHLSVFREIDPDAVARVGRTGRHRVAPIDFWKNESISYSTDGSMTAIVKNQDTEPAPKRSNYRTSAKSKKRNLTTVEEEEVELDPWEAEDGRLRGNYKDFDVEADVTTNDVMEDDIAWAPKGVEPKPAGEDSFYFARLGSASGNWFNWGVIELRPDQMKRSKNSRKMHLVFNVQYGTVEAKIAENEFTVHKNGIWQCPRGNQYSIKNIGSTTARVFFAQACQTVVKDTTAFGNAED